MEQPVSSMSQHSSKRRSRSSKSSYLGDIAQERLRKAFVALMIALLIGLMITTLAVMAQKGVIAASTWVLGSTLTAGFLSLAAKFGMMTLGAPALITLLVLSTWFIAGCVIEMRKPGFFAETLGLSKNWSSEDSHIFYVGKHSQDYSFSNKNIETGHSILFVILTFPIGLLFTIAWGLLRENKENNSNNRRPGHIIASLWLTNFILSLLVAPFLALGLMVDSAWSAGKSAVVWLRSLGSKRGRHTQLLDLRPQGTRAASTADFVCEVYSNIGGGRQEYELHADSPVPLGQGESIQLPTTILGQSK